MKSLIQERMELNRLRSSGVLTCLLAGIYMTAALVWLALGSPHWVLTAFQVLLGAIGLGYGIVVLFRYRARATEFNRRHGVAAGNQDVVGGSQGRAVGADNGETLS